MSRCKAPAFIKANTPVIQQALTARGYKHQVMYSSDPNFDENNLPYIYCYRDSWICGSETMKSAIEEVEQRIDPSFHFTDCGTDSNFFLTLVAYTDANDRFQAFTNGSRWHVCDSPKWAGSSKFHKAAPREIIRKYKGNV